MSTKVQTHNHVKPSQSTTIKPIHVSWYFMRTMLYNLLSHNHACMQNN